MVTAPPIAPRVSRRSLLIGGGAAAGLVVAWGLWPRHYGLSVPAGPGETVLDAFLKIDTAGRVTVIVPQAEMGQGVWTALPQILADELGADWRQVGVEPAPLSPLYANRLLAEEAATEQLPAFLHGIGGWAAREYATRNALMITAGSTSIRAFEQPLREAGATARALLCMAAAKRIGADWRACDTAEGFVVRGEDRLRFGDLVADAARLSPPETPPLRALGEGGLSGKSVARLDLPAKVDGSMRFAGDVRFPGMLFASIRHGPPGDTRPADADPGPGVAVSGPVKLVRNPRWVAALAPSWWAADRALVALNPRFATTGALPDDAAIARALDGALAGGGTRLVHTGDADVPAGPGQVEAVFEVPLAPHATIEPLVATARPVGDRLEVWLPTQAPGLARDAVARATGFAPGRITIFAMPVGGGFGRKIETDAAVEAAIFALEAKRPVQLMWSREEEMIRGRHRPPVKARLTAALAGGRLAAWHATIATPAAAGALMQRLAGHGGGGGAEMAALEGAQPPYAIPALSLSHAPADIGLEVGLWRGAAHGSNAFFTECFIDELAAAAGSDPLGFRMAHLTEAPRLARCLQRVAAAGGWTGEAGGGQGFACHSAFGSHIALLAEAAADDGAIRVSRLTAVVDCGRMINPDIVRQQIESGLVWGMASALSNATGYAHGIPHARTLDDLHLPRLAAMPEIAIELLTSHEAPGGVAELAVPVAAPATANALASATGRRLRRLPLA